MSKPSASDQRVQQEIGIGKHRFGITKRRCSLTMTWYVEWEDGTISPVKESSLQRVEASKPIQRRLI